MTSLVEKLEARAKQRPSIAVPASSFAPGVEGESILMVPLSLEEQHDAVEDAVRHRKELLKDIPEKHAARLMDEPEFLKNIEVSYKLWRACRTADDREVYAFPSAQWMLKTFTFSQMARLSTFFGAVERIEAGTKVPITEEDRLKLVKACAEAAATEVPDVMLSDIPPFVVNALFVWLCQKYTALLEAPKAA